MLVAIERVVALRETATSPHNVPNSTTDTSQEESPPTRFHLVSPMHPLILSVL